MMSVLFCSHIDWNQWEHDVFFFYYQIEDEGLSWTLKSTIVLSLIGRFFYLQ